MEMDKKNQIMDKIKKTLEMEKPSKAKILSYLYTLQSEGSLSNLEFFDIIGNTFKLSPKFFMISIYPKIRPKFLKIYGDEGLQAMERYILEKFCLDKGEQIICVLNGTISQRDPKKYNSQVKNGTIYIINNPNPRITNHRIIAQGKFSFLPHTSTARIVFDVGPKNPKKAGDAYIYNSEPCYGYKFPTYNLNGLTKDNHKLSYSSIGREITIITSKKENIGDILFSILDKFQIQN